MTVKKEEKIKKTTLVKKVTKRRVKQVVKKKEKRYIEAIGRRKEAIARVRLIQDKPGIQINGKELKAYFPLLTQQKTVLAPFLLTNSLGKFFVSIKTQGGGASGQAQAIRLGISRCLVKAKAEYRPILKKAGFLTRDARVVERKKYGHKKARKKSQWSKR